MNKTCTKCQTSKPTTEFFFKNKTKGTLHAQCKDCYRKSRKKSYPKYYENSKGKIRDRALRVRAENKEKMCDYLSDKYCVKCGFDNMLALEFHHREPNDKVTEVSRMVHDGFSWSTIEKEISKCDILCANCHKIETAIQSGNYKLR